MLIRILPLALAVVASGLLARAVIAAETGTPTLYERMGGAATIAAVSNQLIDETAAKPELKRSFDGVNIPRVKTMLIEQICALANGPCTYTGDTMVDVHAGLNITEAEMYGMVELLREIMIRHKVGLRERNELLALLAPMKRDVVTK
jgi:hemoglobin